jgi:small multidrug resistance family-3 protein
MEFIDKMARSVPGALLFLVLAAFLEAFGDSLFQTGFYRTSGWARGATLVLGAVTLAAYGATVNLPRWDFGRLIGVYILFFFVLAQVLNKVRFGQSPTPPIWVGGTLIVAGGLVMAFWQK